MNGDSPRNITILLDADEVIFDFVAGSARSHGIEPDALNSHRTPGVWDISGPLGELAIGRPFTPEEFWAPINYGREEFWENLDLLPWFKELVEFVEEHSSEWHIVSAPSKCPTSYNGKVRAFKKVFGNDFDRFILTPHKSLFAKSNTILIDDRDENVEKFIQAGGQGIVFPTIGNSRHAHRDFPISRLEISLVRLLEQRD